MAPSIIWPELPNPAPPIRVLDPMCGSGTALVMSKMRGHEAIGFDSDPLAVIISRAWCADVSEDRIKRQAAELLKRAEDLCGKLRLKDAYPQNADHETRKFVRFWFDRKSRKQLTALALSIAGLRGGAVRDLLWCAFSRLIITKQAGASLAMDVSHSRPHRVYAQAPITPFRKFMRSVDSVMKGIPVKGNAATLKPRISLADARRLPLDDATVDLVVTSPPYLNAIDYLRGHKLALVWLGHSIKSLRRIRSTNVGTECSGTFSTDNHVLVSALKKIGPLDKLAVRFRRMLAQYILDMHKVIGEVSRVLRSNGRAVLIVGNSTLRGVFIRNSTAITHIARLHGFLVQSVRRRSLPENRRYLPPPSSKRSGSQLAARMTEEVVIRLLKP